MKRDLILIGCLAVFLVAMYQLTAQYIETLEKQAEELFELEKKLHETAEN